MVKYINSTTKVKIICPKHGIFKQIPASHLKSHGCSVCNESMGEKEIAEILNSNSINYKRQYTFKDCKNINLLPFDFYLPEYNICIEYDGEQHFIQNDFFGGEESFIELKKRDEIKTNYCIDSSIGLLRIKYNEHISNKLKEIINEHR